MNRIQTSLETLFNDDRRWPHDGRRLIFWYDADGQFQDSFNELALDGIEKIQLSDDPFNVKYALLIENPHTHYLIYAAYPEPPKEDNWLLDIQLYSLSFSADPAALIYADLGLNKRHLETTIRENLKFFNNKKRTESLQKMALPADTDERGLFVAMLSVLAGLKVPDANPLIRQVLMKGLLESDNLLWQEIEKFDLATPFWQLVKDQTSFASPHPGLNKLFKSLIVTHFQTTLRGKLPNALTPYLITPGQRAYAFIDQWIRDRQDVETWKKLSGVVSEELNLSDILETLTPDAIYESPSFELIDQHILRYCIRNIRQQHDFSPPPEWIQARKTLIWYEQYQDHYAALEAAITLFSLKNQYPHGFKGTAAQLFEAYATGLYRFDGAYRLFIVAGDNARGDILKPLIETIENLYTGWYLEELGEAWSDAMGARWELEEYPSQTRFYSQNIQPVLDRSEREKVFVIISDALRYEVADTLKTRIHQELRGDISLEAYFGVLPSVTKVGMAALLPGTKLSLKPGTGDALRDGLSTQGSPARETVLAQNSGVAAKVIPAKDLLAMNTEGGREAIQPYRLVYIYHNIIDAIGDKAASEIRVLEAGEDTLAELLRLVKKICNSLNGTRVFITADHGFLYQRRPITDAEKRPLPAGADILETDRRYVLGNGLHAETGTKAFTLPYDDITVVVPRGSLRFAKQGAGSQFVHGGASLQEICVPVISYHHKRANQSDEELARKVGVEVNARVRRVTNNRLNLNLVQTEPVAGRWRSRRVSVALYHPEDNEPITDIQSVELSHSSAKPSERTFTVRLTITSTQPPLNANLIIKDADDDSEVLRESWAISLGIINDFGDF